MNRPSSIAYYARPYDAFVKHLIERGHAIKDEKGDYYEVITVRVIDVSPGRFIVIDRGRKDYYRKIGD